MSHPTSQGDHTTWEMSNRSPNTAADDKTWTPANTEPDSRTWGRSDTFKSVAVSPVDHGTDKETCHVSPSWGTLDTKYGTLYDTAFSDKTAEISHMEDGTFKETDRTLQNGTYKEARRQPRAPALAYFDGIEVASTAPPLSREQNDASGLILSPISKRGRRRTTTDSSGKKSTPWHRRWIIIALLVAIVVIIVIAAVLGGVLASRKGKDGAKPSDNGSGSNSAIGAGSSSSTSSSPSSTNTAASRLRSDTAIAAISFTDKSNMIQYRLYYQDPSNNIRESSWNASGNQWYESNSLVSNKAKASTPLAAAVLTPNDLASDTSGFGIAENRPSSPITSIYFLDESNSIQELMTDNMGDTWKDGSVTGQKIVANERSRLAAIYHSRSPCKDCPNTRVMVYQDANKQLQLLNGTLDNINGQSSYALNASVADSSGLGITMRWRQDWIPGLRIYYQTPDGHACPLWWEEPPYWAAQNASNFSTSLRPDANGWQNRETQPLGTIPLVSELGIFTSPTTLADSNPALMEAVASGPGPITTIPWVGNPDGGQWVPLSSPSIFTNKVKAGSKIDANADGHWYVSAVGGGIKEFWVDLDGTTWHEGGIVVPA